MQGRQALRQLRNNRSIQKLAQPFEVLCSILRRRLGFESRKLLETAPPPNDVARLQTSSDNDNSSDHNDIRADFGATWQIRYTTIHGRLRMSGRTVVR
ncbi:MAG: hypothetical protein ACXWJ0_15225, partial [Xanthobacteraceae bacterium]